MRFGLPAVGHLPCIEKSQEQELKFQKPSPKVADAPKKNKYIKVKEEPCNGGGQRPHSHFYVETSTQYELKDKHHLMASALIRYRTSWN